MLKSKWVPFGGVRGGYVPEVFAPDALVPLIIVLWFFCWFHRVLRTVATNEIVMFRTVATNNIRASVHNVSGRQYFGLYRSFGHWR